VIADSWFAKLVASRILRACEQNRLFLVLPAFLTTLLFSLSAVFANRTARILGGVAANFYRLCLATALLAVWSHTAGKGVGGGAFGWFFLSGCIGLGVGDLALYQALPRVGPRLTVLLVQCLAAPFGALLEWLWLGTELTGREVVWGLVILAGVALALAPREHWRIPSTTLAAGILFGVVAALGQGGGAVVSRKAYAVVQTAGQHIDGLSSAYQRILGGLIFAAAPALWIRGRSRKERRAEKGDGPPGKPPTRLKKVLPWIVWNSLAGPTLGVGCYQWALENNPSGVVLPIVATTPIVVIPFAYWFEGDRPGRGSLLGGLIAVAGSVALALSR